MVNRCGFFDLINEKEGQDLKVNDRHVSFYYENDNDYGTIQVEPAKTALLVIDMQHVFITRPKLENPT